MSSTLKDPVPQVIPRALAIVEGYKFSEGPRCAHLVLAYQLCDECPMLSGPHGDSVANSYKNQDIMV